jgi:hypothetical protein
MNEGYNFNQAVHGLTDFAGFDQKHTDRQMGAKPKVKRVWRNFATV